MANPHDAIDKQLAANSRNYDDDVAKSKARKEAAYRDSLSGIDSFTAAQTNRMFADALQREVDGSPAGKERSIKGMKQHFGKT